MFVISKNETAVLCNAVRGHQCWNGKVGAIVDSLWRCGNELKFGKCIDEFYNSKLLVDAGALVSPFHFNTLNIL